MGVEQRASNRAPSDDIINPLPDRGRIYTFPDQPKSILSQRRIHRDIKRWPETDGYPPISGASGAKETDNPEAAREFIRNAFNTDSERYHWGQRTKNRKKNLEIVKKLTRLRKLYPQVYEEVLREFESKLSED